MVTAQFDNVKAIVIMKCCVLLPLPNNYKKTPFMFSQNLKLPSTNLVRPTEVINYESYIFKNELGPFI